MLGASGNRQLAFRICLANRKLANGATQATNVREEAPS
jgi:hypothetical protein